MFWSKRKHLPKNADKFVSLERILCALATVKSDVKNILDGSGVSIAALEMAISDFRKGRTVESVNAEDSFEALKNIRQISLKPPKMVK